MNTKRNSSKHWKWILWAGAGLLLLVFLVRSFRPAPVPVDVATIQRGPLLVTVDEDGWTRVRERYTIPAPIQGHLLRTTLDPGDPVRAHDTIVAEFAPISPGLLDARSRAEALARLARAEAAVKEMSARQEQASADLELASAELGRIEGLVKSGVSSSAKLDAARRDEQRAREGFRAAQFAVEVAGYEEKIARASLKEPGEEPDGGESREGSTVEEGRHLRLHSPVSGRVLRVYEESARYLPAGSPILQVGNTELLEIVADLLTQDAVKVRPGMEVLVSGWGGEEDSGEERVLRGRVRVVEPGGFTRVSALGVEEQRVNVIVDPVGEKDSWATLGDGFRVELQIILWQEEDVLTVPAGALFREGSDWVVFVVQDARARRQAVRLGKRGSLRAQVLEGLQSGDQVILYPSELIEDGAPVKIRG